MFLHETNPDKETYWRSIILFGSNVASYKFALAKSLIDLGSNTNDLIKLEDLSIPYTTHLCEHLKNKPKQITSKSSRFLDACNRYNRNEISKDQLINFSVKRGFENVIDAFHIVRREPIRMRFFYDERKNNKGIRLTDDFYNLISNTSLKEDLEDETESRWRLVESAWEAGVSKSLMSIKYDKNTEELFTFNHERRVDVTSCRGGLNGYQKGRCFYCCKPISIKTHSEEITHVDHFLPWSVRNEVDNINGIWNLVLACQSCNLKKSNRHPKSKFLDELHKRNEYLINSHHPLRETIIQQTGKYEKMRIAFLTTQYNKVNISYGWSP